MTGFSIPKTDPELAHFAELLPGAFEEVRDVKARIAAFEAFSACGLPHRRVEAWKYTDVSNAVKGPFTRPHDGVVALTIPKEVDLKVVPVFPEIAKDQPFALLSRAFSHGIIRLTVPAETVIDEPVEIELPAGKPNQLLCPGLDIRVGAGSRVDFRVRAEGLAEGVLFSMISHIAVGENASVSFTKTRSGEGSHFSWLRSRQAAGSRLSLFDAAVGGELTRNDVFAELEGSGAELDLNGFYLQDAASHADNHTAVRHAVPDTASRQLYKGIVGGRATGVFNGRIIVDPGASGTDALQMNRNLLCSRKAKVDTKPQLEIGNDDVRCSHGATIGRLDEAQLFYLQSRGLDRSAAEALLARGFVGEVIDLAAPAARELLDGLTATFFAREEEA